MALRLELFESNDKDWKKILEYKYNISKPNILCSRTGVGSPFWKSVMTWALHATKPFYRWNVGNGDNVSSWHDLRIGEYSLKTEFWDLFYICDQPDCSISQVWDGVNLE